MVMRRSLLGILSLMVLAGCDSEKPPLEGKRLAVVEYQSRVKIDPEAAKYGVTLPAMESVPAWGQLGANSSHVMPHADLGASPKVMWTSSLGSGNSSSSRVLSTPIAVDGKVYGMDSRGFVSAIESSSGSRLWQVDVSPEGTRGFSIFGGGSLGGGVAYEAGLLFVTTPYAEVLALNPENGEVKWRTKTSSPVRAAPTVQDGKIYVVSINNQLDVFESATGKKLWSHAGITEHAGLLGTASPAVSQGVVIVTYSSGEIFALKVENGHELWSETLSSSRRPDSLSNISHIRALPVISGNLVLIVGHHQKMGAFDLRSGQKVWERQVGGLQTPVVAGDFIYLLSQHNELIALTKDHGLVAWITPLPRDEKKPHRIMWAGPILAGEKLYLVGQKGELKAFDPKTGQERSSQDIGGRFALPPIVSQSVLYLLGENGTVTAIH
ncbi:Outer membrane protein assembly factor BamB [Candidatus Bealeia paramacronuclearis]|uniref:Outer membrane protein assembly factor BamB n=1 Tax=Candidatus Bealeia paramacronuclearis TaxID=1921001 RepID=A0ABZ2C2W5_9PROT|nr:Outer membrane protein assembly factor BamB [Candidatus Bealeia paramacronuclearis]